MQTLCHPFRVIKFLGIILIPGRCPRLTFVSLSGSINKGSFLSGDQNYNSLHMYLNTPLLGGDKGVGLCLL